MTDIDDFRPTYNEVVERYYALRICLAAVEAERNELRQKTEKMGVIIADLESKVYQEMAAIKQVRKEIVADVLSLLEKYYDGKGLYQALGLVDAIKKLALNK